MRTALFIISSILIGLMSSCITQESLRLEITDDAFIRDIDPDLNLGDRPQLAAVSWTRNGIEMTTKFYINFEIDERIASATQIILSTRFFSAPKNMNRQIGNNKSFISLIENNWSEETITWANQPKTDTNLVINVPGIFESQMDYVVDITELIKYNVNNKQKFHGICVELQEFELYSQVLAASKEHPDSSYWPYIKVIF